MDTEEPERPKPKRPRKKQLYRMIREQIEFYLGDVNLSKDRFFANLLSQSPYIDIEYFLRCNKVQQLTNDPQDVVKAISYSKLISVTEDGTKLFRTQPVSAVENEDERTIYVEDLPPDVDHEWLKHVFQTYDKVDYVSLPKFKHNGNYKGFAFVQFDSPEGASKALEAFKRVGCCLSSDMKPEALRSVETYEGDKNVVITNQPHSVYDIQYAPGMDEESSETDNACGVSEHCDTEEIPEENAKDSKECQESGDMKKKKKRGKRKSKEEVVTYGMQILSKKDWKKLRNKYLEEQKKKARELKQLLWKRKRDLEESSSQDMAEKSEPGVDLEFKESTARVCYTPGVIVKFCCLEPITNLTSFKANVNRHQNVEYIDAEVGTTEAYIRCKNAESAENFVAATHITNKTYILQGEEEQWYWEKIFKDRDDKMNNKKRKKIRGRDKLRKKMGNVWPHIIKFNENENLVL